MESQRASAPRQPSPQADKLLFYLSKGANKAIRDYRMIEDGDRIAVAVSGGKDSLTLLRLLVSRQPERPEKYEVVALHVTAEAEMCGGPADRAALEAHLQGYGLPYAFVPLETASGQPTRRAQSPCFHCAWRRRKALFQAAAQLGCNKIAFGHHADDLAETTLLNLFFQGRIETMEPRRAFFDERLTVIRPLAYIEEKEIIRYARVAGFPAPPRPCLGEDRSRRELMHQLIEQVRQVDPRVKINLFRAAARPLPKLEQPDREDKPTEEGETMSPNTIESVYFDKPGWENTEQTLAIARRHAEEAGIRTVVVATTSGATGRQVAERFQGYNVVVVTHSTGFQEPNQQELTPENRAAIEQLGGKIVTTAHAFGGVNRGVRIKLGTYELDEIIAHTLRLFGQGAKVACEIALMAADAGLIRTDEDAICIGGSGRGADTAVVLRPANAMRFFDLRVRRVLCKPQEF